MLASLVLLPLISDRFGSSGWIALGLGQGIGAMVSVLVGMVWPVIGGNAVAVAQDTAGRRDIFRLSAYSRIAVLLVLLCPAIPLTLVLAPRYPGATTLFMVGVALNGLSAAWYYAGVGEPRHLVVNEGMVRLGGYTVSLAGLLLGASLLWYSATMVVTGLVMFALNWFTIMGRSPFWSVTAPSDAWREIRSQLRGTLSRALEAAFSFGGTTIFATFAPAALPLFSALDQVQKAGNNTLSFLPSTFVQWVGSADGEHKRSRMVRSMAFLSVICILIVPSWALLGPFILNLLFAGQVSLSLWGHLVLAAAISLVLFTAAFELLVLIPLGFANVAYVGNSGASILGVVLIAAGAVTFGALGGVGAWIVVQSLLVGYFVVVLLRRRRRAPDASEATASAAEPGGA
eukprot:GHVU01236318.1.p1 GENE.GHVU01236318.1~~GHVU01236318.1.p1  ORF type:complete len:401 (+),score=41.95 GHVU01236318.1:1129-2331(+)